MKSIDEFTANDAARHRATKLNNRTRSTSEVAKRSSTAFDRPSVAVCAITFRRPEWLEKLLRGIAALRFEHIQPEVRVVIVENEEDGPGRAVCDRLRPEFPFPLEYHVEPRRGIPFARNTAVERAGEVDFIAFIDDDEVPASNWLDELLRVQSAHDSDLVGGPILPIFERTPPDWISRGRFHEHLRYPTGTRTFPNGTNNVLIRRERLSSIGTPFDEQCALSGGTDSRLFARLGADGATSVWADEAIVHEWIPMSRCTLRWLARRSFRIGINHGSMARDFNPCVRSISRIVGRGSFLVVRGLVTLPVHSIRGKEGVMLSFKYLTRGAGIFCGLLGFRYQEYKTIHGH
ncbi:MAG: glycosyltransferase [Pirellulales bacterium]